MSFLKNGLESNGEHPKVKGGLDKEWPEMKASLK